MISYSTKIAPCSWSQVVTPTALWRKHLSLGRLPCWLDSRWVWLRYPSHTTLTGQDSCTLFSCVRCTWIPLCMLPAFSHLGSTRTPFVLPSWLVSLGRQILGWLSRVITILWLNNICNYDLSRMRFKQTVLHHKWLDRSFILRQSLYQLFCLWGDIPKYHLSLLHIQILEFPNSLSLSCQRERRDVPHPAYLNSCWAIPR